MIANIANTNIQLFRMIPELSSLVAEMLTQTIYARACNYVTLRNYMLKYAYCVNISVVSAKTPADMQKSKEMTMPTSRQQRQHLASCSSWIGVSGGGIIIGKQRTNRRGAGNTPTVLTIGPAYTGAAANA